LAKLPVKPGNVLKTLEQVKREAKKPVSIVIVGPKNCGKKTLKDSLTSSSSNTSEIFSVLDLEAEPMILEESIRAADAVLIMLDAAADLEKDAPKAEELSKLKKSSLIILNKVDLTPDLEAKLQPVWDILSQFSSKVIFISALKGLNVEEELVPKIYDLVDSRGKGIALAARAPIFRRIAASRIIHHASAQNGLIGAVTILPGADMPLLTANQLRMVLKIAAVYNEELTLTRLKELITVVGTGFTLRALARQLLDLVPGVGWVVKGAVAFTGTEALGLAAQKYFEKGYSHLTAENIKETYRSIKGGKVWRRSKKN